MLRRVIRGAASLWLIALYLSSNAGSVAQTAWINPSSGLWRLPENWSAGVPAVSTTTTLIENAGAKTVLIDAATPAFQLMIERLQIGNAFGATNLLLLQDLPAPLLADGTVTVKSGGRIRLDDSELRIDGTSGASCTLSGGEIDVAGGTLNLVNAARGRIGFGTNGTLRILSGNVTAGEDLLVGALDQGDGYLELQEGALHVAQLFNVADDPGSTGIVSVLGGTLTATNDILTARIGDDGHGRLIVAGGSVEFDDVSIGRAFGSLGEMMIAAGTVRTHDISLGRFPGANGSLVVDGGNLLLPEDSLVIGREGSGSVVLNGGNVQAETVLIVLGSSAPSTLAVSGGALNVTSNIWVGNPSGAAGTLTLSAGNVVATNATGTASLVVANGNLTVTGGVLQVDQMSVTNQAATVTFSAGTVQTRGTRIENGRKFVIGDGLHPATFHLEGGTHIFTGGLEISPNAVLSGCGTVVGAIENRGTMSLCENAAPQLINPRVAAGLFSFDFTAQSTSRHVVEYKTNLGQAQWTMLRTYEAAAGTVTVTDPAAGVSRFYRVRVE